MSDLNRATVYIASVSKPDYSGYEWLVIEDREALEGGGRTIAALHANPRIRAAWQVDNVASMSDAHGALLAHVAGQYIGSGITITQLVPRPLTEGEKLDAARSVLRADYWADVRGVCDDIRAEIERGNLTDSDDVTERIDETVDGHQRVIYTGQALETLYYSAHTEAYYDDFGNDVDLSDGGAWSRLAYSAFRADILDTLGNIDGLLVANSAECYFCDDPITTDDRASGNVGAYEDRHGRNHAMHNECPSDDDDDAAEQDDNA